MLIDTQTKCILFTKAADIALYLRIWLMPSVFRLSPVKMLMGFLLFILLNVISLVVAIK